MVFILIIFFKDTQFLKPKPPQDDTISQFYANTIALSPIQLSPFRYYEKNGKFSLVLDQSFDFDSVLRIKKKRKYFYKDNIASKRKELIEYIWKGKGLPKRIPNTIEEDIIDLRYETLNNLEKIDRLVIEMDYGVNSISYLLHPVNPNNKLIVYHGGHSGDPINRNKTMQSFLDEGYTLLTFTMPLFGMNSQPVIKNLGKFTEHESFPLLDTEEFTSIKFFLEPIYVSLNYINENYDFCEIYMTGLSGGGWTTTIYSAIDTRIDKSYPIAGSLPLIYPVAGRDYEQLVSIYFDIADYLDLYIMASHKRKQIQILNSQDSCCFRGILYEMLPYENKINEILSGEGEFKVHIEPNDKHSITDNVVNLILEDMRDS